MKVTKYPQSCLVIEKNGKRLMIDPGSFVAEKYEAVDLLPLDGVLITHVHPDHANPKLISEFAAQGVPIIANAGTQQGLGADLIQKVVVGGEALELAGFAITAYDIPHVPLPGDKPRPENTGYVIDGMFLHPGDGTHIEGITADYAAIPIAGPDISPKDAFDLALQLRCKKVIPIHYNYFIADPDFFAQLAAQLDMPFTAYPLKDGESVEL